MDNSGIADSLLRMELDLSIILLLALAAFLAGFVDSIAGGGGIITVPALLVAGLPPHLALGTNKLQASFGSFTAMMNYRRKGLVSARESWQGIVFTFIGAMSGTLTVHFVSPGPLRLATLIMLCIIFTYTAIRPRMGSEVNKARIGRMLFFFIFGLVLGFYDGFFGPGTGSFWTIAFVGLLGFDMKVATAHTKLVNFTSNIVSLGFFLILGHVALITGLAMGAAQVLGAFTGSTLVLRKGTGFVRLFFLVVTGVTILKLIYDSLIS